MKLVIAATGASGAIYLQRLLAQIDPIKHEVHLVLSSYAKQSFTKNSANSACRPVCTSTRTRR